MADNTPITSIDSELVSAGLNRANPQGTYTDFAAQIAKNRQEQEMQEQAIARAMELTSQAKHQTKEEKDAEDAGYNSLLANSMTPEQAVAYLKIVLKSKGLPEDATLIDEWAKTLPPRVSSSTVETFANRFAKDTTRSGAPAMFDRGDKLDIPAGVTAKDLGLIEDESDATIGHVPEKGMYSVLYDNEGKIKRFIPAGKEAVDSSLKLNARMGDSTEKQWQALNKQIDTAFKTRSGGLGSLTTAIFRSVRAINTINATKNITAQDLANISQDIAGIYQGGAPTVVASKENDYQTVFTNFQKTFLKYTGVLVNFRSLAPLEDTKNKLLQVLVDLRDSSIDNLESYFASQEPAYRQIIEENPKRWEDMQHEKMNFVASGLLLPPGGKSALNITGIEDAKETKDPKHVEGSSGQDEKKAALRKKLGLKAPEKTNG